MTLIKHLTIIDGAVVSTLDKIMTAAPDCGVLMSCGSTDIGAASDVFSKGKIKQSRGAIPMLMHSIEPKGDQSVIRMFLDKGWLVGHILRIIITCLGCGRDKHGILSSREKDSFCRLCLKVCVVFGAQLVSSATEQCALLLSSEPHKQNAISVWKSAVATVDTKKFVNILKNNFK